MPSTNAVLRSEERAGAIQSTVIAGYAMAIGRTLEHRGVDAGAIFRAVGLPERVSNDPLNRMTSASTAALFRACVEATEDPYFGLAVAQFVQVSNIHALGHGLLASSSLLDACSRFARNFALASQSATPRVERSRTEVALRFRHLVPVCGESEDACLAFVANLMHLLHHKAVHPIRVEFRHACPTPGPAPYAELFGVIPQFGQEETALVWPVAVMLEPLLGECLELAHSNDKLPGEYIARLDLKDVSARVRALVAELLPSGRCSRLRVAHAMNMSETSLQLKLAEHGTSFSAVLDATRKDMALAFLSQQVLSIAKVGYRVGFADTSNFARAFKRWTGKTPSEQRLNLLGMAERQPPVGSS